ncbi:MAG: aminoacyl-tRNA hydrolase [Patescibacteria group bacterium]|nr:aminoacyl-tRNA hydrolase [Patescibacteria group bacterium]
MKYIVGLGNPGSKYQNNRHNAGFMAVDRLMKEKWSGVKWLKPQTFMNKSGTAVKKFLGRREEPNLPSFANLYVAHDDLDIELGKFKISWGKGPKVHNGLRSIYEQLGTKDFWHVRIGIDNRMKTGFRGTGEEYVLQNFRPEEREIVEKVIDKIVMEMKKVL